MLRQEDPDVPIPFDDILAILQVYAYALAIYVVWFLVKSGHDRRVDRGLRTGARTGGGGSKPAGVSASGSPAGGSYGSVGEGGEGEGGGSSASGFEVRLTGYRSHFIGSLLFWGVFLGLFTALGLTLLIIWNEYCIDVDYSQYRWKERARPLIVIKLVWVTISFVAISLQNQLKLLFMLRATLGQCSAVAVWKRDDDTESLHDNKDRLTRAVSGLIGYLRSRASGSAPGGRTYYANVRRTKEGVRFFDLQCTRFVWRPNLRTFTPADGDTLATARELCASGRGPGLSPMEVRKRRDELGLNHIHVEVSGFFGALVHEVADPVFLFQMFCLLNSLFVRSIVIPSCWGLSILWTLATKTAIVVSNQRDVRDMAEATSVLRVSVRRKRREADSRGEWTEVAASELVPGDVLRVEDNWHTPCDCALVNGQAVVDEASLTGESMPVQKHPLPEDGDSEVLHPDKQKTHFLFSGTKVLKVSLAASASSSSAVAASSSIGATGSAPSPVGTPAASSERDRGGQTLLKQGGSSDGSPAVLGLVVRTGAATSRGKLIRNVLFPSTLRFKYDEQLPIVFVIMALYTVAVFLLNFYSWGLQEVVFFYGVSSISQCMPIWVPVILAIGHNIAASRLRKANSVYCLDPARIPVCGKVRVMCFDKTGTLTKDGIDFIGARPAFSLSRAASRSRLTGGGGGGIGGVGVGVAVPASPAPSVSASALSLSLSPGDDKALSLADHSGPLRSSAAGSGLESAGMTSSLESGDQKNGGEREAGAGGTKEEREKQGGEATNLSVLEEKEKEKPEAKGQPLLTIPSASSSNAPPQGTEKEKEKERFVFGQVVEFCPHQSEEGGGSSISPALRKRKSINLDEDELVPDEPGDPGLVHSHSISGIRDGASGFSRTASGVSSSSTNNPWHASLPSAVLYGLASCHSLTCLPIIPEGKDKGGGSASSSASSASASSSSGGDGGLRVELENEDDKEGVWVDNKRLVGNDLELKMFGASSWRFVEVFSKGGKVPESVRILPPLPSGVSPGRPIGGGLEILKVYEFDHGRQTMSVVVREVETGIVAVYCKGSFEKIKEKCVGGLPAEAQAVADTHAKEGVYTLALASKRILDDRVPSRDSAEHRLTFLSLILFRNELKPESPQTIRSLKAGRVRSVMITGDHPLTAVHIARAVGMLQTSQTTQTDPSTPSSNILFRHDGGSPRDGGGASRGGSTGLSFGPASPTVVSRQRLPSSPPASQPQPPVPLLLGEMKNGELRWTEVGSGKQVDTDKVLYGGGYPELAITQEGYDSLFGGPEAGAEGESDGQPRASSRNRGGGIRGDVGSDESAALLSPSRSSQKKGRGWSLLNFALVGGSGGAEGGDGGMLQGGGPIEDSAKARLLMRLRIFARMTPAGKVRVVKALMSLGFVVGMCGDGGNDCGALRAAHAGIALSDADASIVSPFTSKTKKSSSVVDLLREGRGTLVTSLAMYKFMIMYSLLLSSAKTVLAFSLAVMPEFSYFLCDIVLCLGMSNLMALSKPKSNLRIRTPTSSLLGPHTVLSIVITQTLNLAFLFLALHLLWQQPWYVASREHNAQLPSHKWWLRSDNYETEICFLWFLTQFNNAGFIYTFGGMFRQNVFRNRALTLLWLLSNALVLFLIFTGPNALGCLFRVNCDDASTRELYVPFLAQFAFTFDGRGFAGPKPDNLLSPDFRIVLASVLYGNSLCSILFYKYVVLGQPAHLFRRNLESGRGSGRVKAEDVPV
uniref:P-type ATPase A domain-containing protein n=1 Tax=Chromera velia CCMP2878 TaxID=1169474 RepID=A0A0G4GAY7_9ALVE|eukprot:Cvel_4448.t1-p1 / transcript=Cvel_4448.t1 / gene=Cvel_4448 / organism=Chromera_velia_CCMP2878 / gene_product=Probable cation-transporting ATPase 13A3, putative / transcript_product=Probable cation-transporting ATPase 13A3, putative / location=Cvel_scaffold194:22710-33170(+) / protein_length=1732 / sequence_SO=supercontig / SO=protein_coding / is_pseudo=false